MAGLPYSTSAAPLPIETKTAGKSSKNYTVEAEYPQTGLLAIDRVLADHADASMNELIASAEEDATERTKDGTRLPEGLTYSLDVAFTLERNDDSVFAVTLATNQFTGGAHPGNQISTFTFLRPDGWRVFLPEIFSGAKALKRISELAVRELNKILSGPNGPIDPDWVQRGAGPSWGNFTSFILTTEVLILNFQEYQVAPYAAGSQQVRIPISELRGLMRGDWRLPAPSFSCSEARSQVEKAICSDTELARIDRKLAEAYEQKLAEKHDEQDKEVTAAAKEAIRQGQRNWLRHRDSACDGVKVACLTAVYRDRMKAL